MILHPGKTPAGKETRGHLRRLVRMIRRAWPTTRILIRGDSHYGRAEVMAWCGNNGIDCLFGFAGNTVFRRPVKETADDIRTRRALERKPVLRDYAETRYAAKSRKVERRVYARIEATTRGLDIRFVVTNLGEGSAGHIYDDLYFARDQAENLIKMHTCRSPSANQVRLILHTAACWLMLTLRDAVPATDRLRKAEFATLRLCFLKLGARVTETASRIRMPRGRDLPPSRRCLAAGSIMKAGAPMPRRTQNLQHQTRATKSRLNRTETDAKSHRARDRCPENRTDHE